MRLRTILGAVLLTPGCVVERPGPGADRPASFRVTRVEGDPGSAESPLPFSAQGTRFAFDVQALGPSGELSTWDGSVRAWVAPGRLVDVGGTGGAGARLVGGRADAVAVTVALSTGPTRVWFEDVGYAPAAPGSGACENGSDEDGDGRFDWPGDPGCFAANDESEEDGRGGVGVSEPLFFANPTLADVQGRGSRSPLEGASITVDRGELVVSRVAVDGLYVSDAAEEGGFGHAYLFTFSTPSGVRPCDRLRRIDGIVGEFFGFTELSFPSFEVASREGECSIPEPVLLDAGTLLDGAAMESLEAGLVRVENVRVATVRDCDVDGDGSVDFEEDGFCSEECACRRECEDDALCTEETQFRQFGQVAVALEEGAGPKIQLVVDATPDFDAWEHQGETLSSATGTLRHVEFLDPPWLLEPRCPDDLRVEGGPLPITEACVIDRTEPEDEP